MEERPENLPSNRHPMVEPDVEEPKTESGNPLLNQRARQGKPTEDEQLLAAPTNVPKLFTHTDPWRVFRIMAEFVEGFDALAELGPAVTIFGSARVKPKDPMYHMAVEVGRLLGEAGITIITGGGPGIMEAGNRGACMAGAKSVGLNIELPFEQALNKYVDIAVDFHYFFVRKTMLVKYAQGFVIFPGGFGTMDELFESVTLIQTGKVKNFPVILFDTSYWKGLFDWVRSTMLTEGKIAQADLDLFVITDSPEEARDIILHSLHHGHWRPGAEEEAVEVSRQVYDPSRYDSDEGYP